ncbi:hypothetical protein [Streptomyces sp. CB09001]|uniref:hypothetical protein n=1 Tax=Streptomyces sp. CB09001 TaxID=2083284 RepID=UPI001F071B25|nr:hypothetical protein [Streptomyces sp. CB09001]
MSRRSSADGRGSGAPPVPVSRLKDRRFNGYLGHPLPHERDAIVDAVITSYLKAAGPVRQRAIDDLNTRSASVLSVYGQRMASAAVRAGSVDTLRRGLVAVGMAQVRLDDARENLYPLTALNDAASLLGTSLRSLITEVSDSLPPSAVDELHAFDQQQEQDKSLESMGLRRLGSGQTLLYS